MTNQELCGQLYEKMSAEQAKFKEELLKQSPEEILKQGYEYARREEIMYVLDGLEFDEKQASVLLRLEKPLADLLTTVVATESKRVDVSKIIIDSVAIRADEILQEERKLRDIPLYKYPASHEHENGEIETYRASYKANVACKYAIRWKSRAFVRPARKMYAVFFTARRHGRQRR